MIDKPTLAELASKRITGYLNYKRNRSKAMGGDVLSTLVTDMKRHAPDHIALTGDLVNIALDGEIDRAGAWLKTLGTPQDVSLVPGNHDAYVAGALQKAHGAWGAYWQDDERMAVGVADAFPYVHRRGPLALIGLTTAIPTRPFFATGKLGQRQLNQLGSILNTVAEDVIRVIMIHHPPFIEAERNHKRLLDHEAFKNVIAENGADLVLHGHTHRRNVMEIDGPNGPVPVLGVPSAASGLSGKHEAARYNLYRFSTQSGRVACMMEERGLTPGGNFEKLAERDLIIPAR